MSAIHLLVYGPPALAILSLALVKFLVRPKIWIPREDLK